MSKKKKKKWSAKKNTVKKQIKKKGEMREDCFCRGCRFYRPDWDYRFCVFPECKEIKGMETFWEEVYQDV